MDKTADEDDWGCEYCRNDGRLDENGCCPKCASAILDAVQAERAAIVAWLGSPVGNWPRATSHAVILANTIERGEHLPQDTPK